MKTGITNFFKSLKQHLLYIANKNRTYLVVQLDDKTITLSRGVKAGRKLHCSTITTYQLSNLEITHNQIFSPTTIQALLQNFATTNHLTKQKIIALIHFLPDPITNFQLLQITLSLSKTPFTIKHLSQAPISLLPSEQQTHDAKDGCPSYKQLVKSANLLERFLPVGYHATLPLVATFSIVLLATGLSTNNLYQSMATTINQDLQKSNELSETVQKLQGEVKALHNLEQQNAELTNKITTLTTLGRKKGNPDAILTTIAQAMPPQSKLVSLHIGKEKNPHTHVKQAKTKKPNHKLMLAKNTPFTLNGLTHDPEEISNLVKTLSKSFPNTTFALRHSNPKKSTTQAPTPLEPPFKFVIHVAAR